MGVADEVLCRFGQVENGLEVDDLAAGIADGWVGLREKFQIRVFSDGMSMGGFETNLTLDVSICKIKHNY